MANDSMFGGLVAYWTEEAAVVQPRRQVTQTPDRPGVWHVEASNFTTTCHVLARYVAIEYDRIDPLPRAH